MGDQLQTQTIFLEAKAASRKRVATVVPLVKARQSASFLEVAFPSRKVIVAIHRPGRHASAVRLSSMPFPDERS